MDTITKEAALANLRKAAEWIAEQEGCRAKPPEAAMLAQGIVLGCRELLGQACADWQGWTGRKPDRMRRLRQVKRQFPIKAGNRVIRDLIGFTAGAIEAAGWRSEYQTEHLPVWRQSRTLTEEHKRKIAAGRKRAQERRQEALRRRLEAG